MPLSVVANDFELDFAERLSLRIQFQLHSQILQHVRYAKCLRLSSLESASSEITSIEETKT